MIQNAFLMVKYMSQVLPIQLSSDFDFYLVLRTIIEKWSCLELGKFHLVYSIPDYNGCSLMNQQELNTLISLISVLGLQLVDVIVNDSSDCSNVSVESAFVVNGKGDKLGVSGAVDENDESNIPAICSSSNSRLLLSASWCNLITHVGQKFVGGVADFRIALSKYSIEKGFKFDYIRNNEYRVEAYCANKYSEGCNWYVCATASNISGVCFIRKLNNMHNCSVLLRPEKSNRLSSKLIAGLIVDIVRKKPSLSAKDVVSHCLSCFGFDVTYDKAYNALEKAKADIFGDASQSYKKLRFYVEAAKSINPGSHIVLEVDEDSNRFRRLFVAFNACIKGFAYCRPMLFIDGTFLKGKFKGTLLSATGKNGNQGLFPLAFAVVDSENHENWLWFLEHLRIVVSSIRTITFVSDRNVGIMEALPKAFPSANHFFCLQHLKQNLRDKFSRGAFTNRQRERMVWLFRECAYAPTIDIFNHKLAALKEEGGAIVESFLEDLPFKNWSNAHSIGCRYGEMYSNATESFNSWILDCRGLPITEMIDNIRLKLMEWFCERKIESDGWTGILCPKMVEKLHSYGIEGRSWFVQKSSQSTFEIFSNPRHVVDLATYKCSCVMWQLNGYPCVHAVKAISRLGRPIEQYVHFYFHVAAFRHSYEEAIHPISSSFSLELSNNDAFDILPPATRRPPGRPKKRRIRSRGEQVRRIRCGRCGKLGNHNKKTCKEALS